MKELSPRDLPVLSCQGQLPSVAPLGNVVWLAGLNDSCDRIYDFGNIKLDQNRSIIKYGVSRIAHLIKNASINLTIQL